MDFSHGMWAHPHYPRPTQLSNPGYATEWQTRRHSVRKDTYSNNIYRPTQSAPSKKHYTGHLQLNPTQTRLVCQAHSNYPAGHDRGTRRGGLIANSIMNKKQSHYLCVLFFDQCTGGLISERAHGCTHARTHTCNQSQ